MPQVQHIAKSPMYYSRQRLMRNKPALFGLALIVIALIAAILGYLIMPDSSPDANDGAVQVNSRSPGFNVMMIRSRKNLYVEKVSVFHKMLFGQESPYIIIPINRYWFTDDRVAVEEYHSRGAYKKTDSFPLINVVKALYVGKTDKLGIDAKQNYVRKGEEIIYLDLDGNINKITIKELQDEFRLHNLDKRYYYLGTDKNGRDMLSRLIYGTRISLSIGFIAVMISLVIGIMLGAMAGFFRGIIDSSILWLMTVVWSIPSIMLVISISIALQSKSFWVVFIAVGLTTWVEIARVVRGQILSIREKEFVEAARALGYNSFRIIVRHILPNIIGPLIVITSSNFATAILTEAGLSFLGLGVQSPTPSWGMMVHDGFDSIGTQNGWYLSFIPGIFIMVMVLAFNLFGNGLRDAFDPKMIDGK